MIEVDLDQIHTSSFPIIGRADLNFNGQIIRDPQRLADVLKLLIGEILADRVGSLFNNDLIRLVRIYCFKCLRILRTSLCLFDGLRLL